MKLVLGSDLHGYLPEIPEGDILVLAGDILPETEQEIFIKNKLRPWLVTAPVGVTLAVWGNHDDHPFRYDCSSYNLPWVLLTDTSVNVSGLKFHGTPWCKPVGRWAWQAPEYLLEYIYSLIPDDVDILISHTPPYGTCDLVDPKPYKNRPSESAGSRELKDRMCNLKKLKLLVCGHIHEARGVSGVVYNVSCVRRRLKTDVGYTLYENPWTMWEL